MTNQLFSLGQMVATPQAIAALAEDGQTPLDLLKRHVAGDWGDVCPDDARTNEQAVTNGDRIFSVYHTNNKQEKLYVITEWDRSVSTVLMSHEY